MKTKLNWFDRLMLGVTFAEADLPQTGMELMHESGRKGRKQVAKKEADCLGAAGEEYAKGAEI